MKVYLNTNCPNFFKILHEDQRVDEDSELVLCKYMDFQKFLSFVLNSQIYFPLISQFEDSFEADITQLKLSSSLEKIFKNAVDNGVNLGERFRALSFCNDTDECDLMWRAYCPSGGVRLKINMLKFVESIDSSSDAREAFLCKVNYIRDTKIGTKNFREIQKNICPMAFKKAHYKAENEYRIISGTKNVEIKESLNIKNGEWIQGNKYINFIFSTSLIPLPLVHAFQ